MLLQTVALASLWNENQAKTSDLFVAFSILNSVFSVSWETMSALDRLGSQKNIVMSILTFVALLTSRETMSVETR